MTGLSTAISTIVEIVEGVFNVITGNPILMVFLAGGLLAMGIGLFKRFKNASR